ncbi:hypothetical protein IE53DRAFT_370328 [Violaceomyces palustris]|uniref:Uncharacterized protein n=1 Tax=Violaceomyces palustris TaxID=1673888 RepID=A0ACD0NSG3_9BASI|nr:hypothetical protein IE53DRAFT_370328 [Violaceomyces palustris]
MKFSLTAILVSTLALYVSAAPYGDEDNTTPSRSQVEEWCSSDAHCLYVQGDRKHVTVRHSLRTDNMGTYEFKKDSYGEVRYKDGTLIKVWFGDESEAFYDSKRKSGSAWFSSDRKELLRAKGNHYLYSDKKGDDFYVHF